MTNQERLQANNAKIEAIQQALENKVATTGEIEITENGRHDVSKYATAKVDVQPNLITATFTENGTYKASDENADGYSSVDVNLPIPDLSQTTATESDVREGKEFYNASGEKVAGTYNDMLQRIFNARGGYCSFYKNAFNGIENVIAGLNTSSVTTMEQMFAASTALTEFVFPNLDTSNVISMQGCFSGCNLLRSLDVTNLNTNSVNSMTNMFDGCKALQTLDLSSFDTSNVTNMYYMFNACEALQTLDLSGFNTSNVTNMSYMFRNCSKLSSLDISNFNTSNVTDMTQMFASCKLLTILDLSSFNTSKVSSIGTAFAGCTVLETILGELNLIKCTSLSNTFNACKALKTVTLKNINTTLQIGSGSGTGSSDYGHLLTLDTLLNTIQELWTNTSTSTKKLTIGTANTAKLANVYVKLIEITDEMRAEDEYIDNKAPFVQCESTDEGAMLITEYVTTVKKWQLA